MKYFILDISGKVPNYNLALWQSLSEDKDNQYKLFASNLKQGAKGKGLYRLRSVIPEKYKCSKHIIKQLVKASEGIVNYVFVLLASLVYRPTVIHFQWLPYLEFSLIEYYYIRLISLLLPNTKFVLTIHNIYPHDMGEGKKKLYRDRMKAVIRLFDAFVCHTEISKNDIIENFSVERERLYVIHHGVFEPELSKLEEVKTDNSEEKVKLIVYGNQNPYKGTDILIDAIASLPVGYRQKVRLSVVGQPIPQYFEELKEKGKNLDIEWYPYFVEDDFLYREIRKSDVILLPYRAISQSGVLLLALFFDKIIITSDLPSFKETLEGYPSELFFETENVQSLAKVLMRIVDNNVDTIKVKVVERGLRERYSWHAAAKKTKELYQSL